MINLKQAYDLFILSREEFCLPATVKAYQNTLRLFLRYMENVKGKSLEEISLDEITRSDLQSYTLHLRNRPKFENHPFHNPDASGLTKRSIHTYQTDLKSFFNYLYEEELLQENLMKKYRMLSAEKRQLIPLTVEDVEILDSLYNINHPIGCRNLCILHIMLDAGLRVSEVLNLRVCNVNFNQNYIFVSNGKGSKDRIIPLAPRLKKYLYRYIVLHRGQKLQHDFFFCTADWEPVSVSCIRSLFARMRSHLSIPRLYPHLLRHTFATAYVLQGGDLESLRIYMGHSDIATTQTYLHLAAEIRYTVNVYKLDARMFCHL